jgi:hypothetical protein
MRLIVNLTINKRNQYQLIMQGANFKRTQSLGFFPNGTLGDDNYASILRAVIIIEATYNIRSTKI